MKIKTDGLFDRDTVIKELPRMAQALEEAVETGDQFAIRRIRWAAESFRKECVAPSMRTLWGRICVGKRSHVSSEVVVVFEEVWRSLQ